MHEIENEDLRLLPISITGSIRLFIIKKSRLKTFEFQQIEVKSYFRLPFMKNQGKMAEVEESICPVHIRTFNNIF